MIIRKVIVQVDKNSSAYQEMKLSRPLCKKFQLKTGDTVRLQIGENVEEVQVVEFSTTKLPIIEISLDLSKKIGIPYEILPIHCLYKRDENTFLLGPIITCITNQMYHEDQKFGSLSSFFEELARFAKQHHLLFYVMPIGNWEHSFYGYSFQNEQWQHYLFPKPHAVYNRVGSRAFETTLNFQKLVTYLEDEKINFFNHSFLNKWEIHDALSSFPEIKPYLPDTQLFKDYDLFHEMLNKYDCIFLKPVNGSQGKQILRIEKDDKGFTVFYPSLSEETISHFRCSHVLYKRLKERLSKKVYIVQQGINLIFYGDKRPLDFRILCIKNNESNWNAISSVARISLKEKMVSNLAQGGEQKKPLEVLNQLFCEKLAVQYVKLMGELAKEVSNLISESHTGLFGELGVDIALDKNGKLWIIEVNSKPSKIEQDEPTDRIRPSTKAIIAYLAYLTGFPLQRNEKEKRSEL